MYIDVSTFKTTTVTSVLVESVDTASISDPKPEVDVILNEVDVPALPPSENDQANEVLPNNILVESDVTALVTEIAVFSSIFVA